MNADSNTIGTPEHQDMAKLEALIASHAKAYTEDSALWLRISVISDAIEDHLPPSRVQVGKLYRGLDDDGNEIHVPVYAHTPEQIDEHQQPHLRAAIAMWGRTDEDERRIREKYTALADKKKAELATVDAEIKRIEDESGYTDAMDAARASAEQVKAIEAEIVNFKPHSLAAACRQAGWVHHAFEDGDCAYITDEHLTQALAAIAGAVAFGEPFADQDTPIRMVGGQRNG